MNKERAAAYLAQNILPSTVASIVGCSPGYISQLMKEPAFAALIESKRAELDTTSNEEALLDTKYVAIEHKILAQMEANLPNAEMNDLTRALDVISRRQTQLAKAKVPAIPQNPAGQTNFYITQLALPAHILPSKDNGPAIEVNQDGEVVSINARPLAPMNSDTVKKLFDQRIAASSSALAAAQSARLAIDKEF